MILSCIIQEILFPESKQDMKIYNDIHVNLHKFVIFIINQLKKYKIKIEYNVFLLSLKYIHIFRSKNTTSQDICKIWLASLIVSDIYMNDENIDMKDWNIISGIECICLKHSFLTILDFNLHVTLEELTMFERHIDIFTKNCLKNK